MPSCCGGAAPSASMSCLFGSRAPSGLSRELSFFEATTPNEDVPYYTYSDIQVLWQLGGDHRWRPALEAHAHHKAGDVRARGGYVGDVQTVGKYRRHAGVRVEMLQTRPQHRSRGTIKVARARALRNAKELAERVGHDVGFPWPEV